MRVAVSVVVREEGRSSLGPQGDMPSSLRMTVGCSSMPGTHQTGLVCEYRRLCSIGQVELREDPSNVGAGGVLAYEKRRRDLARSTSAAAMRFKTWTSRSVRSCIPGGDSKSSRRRGQLLDHAFSDRRSEQASATSGHTQRGQQILLRGVFEEEPARARSKGFEHVLSGSNVVRINTRGDAVSATIALVASMPLRTGIRMSIITTSGCSAAATVTASCPSAASPMTSSQARPAGSFAGRFERGVRRQR